MQPVQGSACSDREALAPRPTEKRKMASKLQSAVAYLRTSRAANVGAAKDSDKRQRAAIEAFAKRAGFTIVGEYYDKAVSGADRYRRAPPAFRIASEFSPPTAQRRSL